MRDVTDSGSSFRAITKYLINFIKHPVQEMARLPNWSWKTAIWVQIGLSMASGVLAGLVRPNFFGVLFGIIVMPVMSMMMVSLLGAFLYYYFQVFEQRTVAAVRIFTLCVLASIPFFIFQVASPIVPPISLVGFAISAILLVVGLSENFQLERKRAIRLAAVLFSVVLIVWIINQITSYRSDSPTASSISSES